MSARAGLALALVASLAFAFVAGPESVLGGRVTPLGPSAPQADPKVAAFDGGYWIVWSEARATQHWTDVYGARVRADGTLIDPQSRLLVGGPREQGSAGITCGPFTCVLTWYDRVQSRFKAAALSFDGALGPHLDLQGASPTGYGFCAALEDQFLVGWMEGNTLWGRFLDGAGALAGPPLVLTPTAGSPGWLVGAGLGDRYVIAWWEWTGALHEAWSAVVGRDGGLLTSPRRHDPDIDYHAISVTATDAGFAMSYIHRTPTEAELSIQRFDSSGALDGPPEPMLTIGRYSNLVHSIGFSGGALGLVAADSNWVSFQTAPRDGGFSGSLWRPTPVTPSIAQSGAEQVFAWSESGTGFRRVSFSTFDQARLDGGSWPVSLAAPSQRLSAASFDGRGWVAAFTDQEPEGAGAFAVPLSATGAPTQAPYPLGPLDTDYDEVLVSSFDGRRHWALHRRTPRFGTGGPLVAAEVGAAKGAEHVLDPAADFLEGASAAAGGGVTFLVWSRYAPPNSNDIFFARLDADGQLLDPPARPLISQLEYQTSPVVLYARGAFNVLYREAAETLMLRRFAPSALPLELTPTALLRLPLGGPIAGATDGDLLLAAWLDDPGGRELRAARIAGTRVLDAEPLVVAALDDTSESLVRPAVVHDGSSFVVGWLQAPADGGQQLWVRRVHGDGSLGALERVDTGPFGADSFSLTAGSMGRVLAQYGALDPALNAVRLRSRVLAEVPLGYFCASAAECASSECGGPKQVCCENGVCPDPPDAGAGPGAGPSRLKVACGCGAGGGSAALATLALASLRARRRR